MAKVWSYSVDKVAGPNADALSDVITNIHWQVIDDADPEWSGRVYGSMSVGEADPNDFTALASVDASVLETWMEEIEPGIKVAKEALCDDKATPIPAADVVENVEI